MLPVLSSYTTLIPSRRVPFEVSSILLTSLKSVIDSESILKVVKAKGLYPSEKLHLGPLDEENTTSTTQSLHSTYGAKAFDPRKTLCVLLDKPNIFLQTKLLAEPSKKNAEVIIFHMCLGKVPEQP